MTDLPFSRLGDIVVDVLGMSDKLGYLLVRDIESKLFFRLCKRIYAMDSLNLTGTQSYDDAVQAIAELIKTKGYGSDTLLRLELTGSLSPDVDLSAKKIQPLMASLFYCEIIDHTSPDFDIEALKEDPTIKGELVRTLIPALESEDEEMRRCARRALKYGLSALTGNDVSDF